MKSVKIAVIDSGVDVNHRNFINKNIYSVEVVEDKNGLDLVTAITDSHGHGTAVVGIILDKCADVEILSIKVLNEKLRCKFKYLCKALEYAIEQKVDVINLSLGVLNEDYKEELQLICKKAKENNICVVSAHNNHGKVSYPASLDMVYGIHSNEEYYKYGYRCIDAKNKNFSAIGFKQKVHWKDDSFKFTFGNSMACAHFTGIMAYLISNSDCIFYEQYDSLISKNSDSYDLVKVENYKTQKVLMYPLTKKNLLFSEKIKERYDFVGIYDDRYSSIKEFILFQDEKNLKSYIFNRDELEKNDWDMLMVGDLTNLEYEMQRKLICSLLKMVMKLNKAIMFYNIIYYEDYRELFDIAKEKKIPILFNRMLD